MSYLFLCVEKRTFGDLVCLNVIEKNTLKVGFTDERLQVNVIWHSQLMTD